MKELLKKLHVLRKQGYEEVTIDQLLNWASQIKRDARTKRLHLDD